MKTVLLVVASLVISCSGQACPPNWHKSNADPSKCYLVVVSKKIWFDAGNYCASQSQGAMLTSVISAFENYNLNAIVSDTPSASLCSQMWLGGNDFDQNGQFEWIDGKPFNYANWESGQPNLNSNCISSVARTTGKWKTENCGIENCFICELYMSSAGSTAVPATTTTLYTGPPTTTTTTVHTGPPTTTTTPPITTTTWYTGPPTTTTTPSITTTTWYTGPPTTTTTIPCTLHQNIAIVYDTSEAGLYPTYSKLLNDTYVFLKSTFIGSWSISTSYANVVPIPFPNTDQYNAVGAMGALNIIGFTAGQTKGGVSGMFDFQFTILTQGQGIVNTSALSDIEGGLKFVQTNLINNPNNRPNIIDTVIILAQSTSGVNSASATATALKNSGVTILTVAVGPTTDQNILGQLATSSTYTFSLPDPADPNSSALAYNVYTTLLSIPSGNTTSAPCPPAG